MPPKKQKLDKSGESAGREDQQLVKRLHSNVRMSEVSVFQNIVYLAGQVADDASQDIKGQTQQVLNQIDKFLAEVGTNKHNILRAQIFLADIKEFPLLNEVWDPWVSTTSKPSRATVEAKLAKVCFLLFFSLSLSCIRTDARLVFSPAPGETTYSLFLVQPEWKIEVVITAAIPASASSSS